MGYETDIIDKLEHVGKFTHILIQVWRLIHNEVIKLTSYNH